MSTIVFGVTGYVEEREYAFRSETTTHRPSLVFWSVPVEFRTSNIVAGFSRGELLRTHFPFSAFL